MNNTNTTKSTKYARGTVWWVDLKSDPMCVTSQTFKRPCLIISNDDYNVRCDKRTVIPMSSQNKYNDWSTAVHTIYEGADSYILCDQIRQIDIKHFIGYVFTVNPKCMQEVEKIISDCYLSNVSTLNYTRPYTTSKSTEVYTDKNDKEFTTKICVKNDAVNKDNFCKINNTVNDNTTDNNTDNSTNVANKSSITDLNRDTYIQSRDYAHSPTRLFFGKCSSKMPQGFYSLIENNIKWWNDYLNEGQDYVMKKYNLDTVIRFQKRKYIVKKKLLDKHYDLSKPIAMSTTPTYG